MAFAFSKLRAQLAANAGGTPAWSQGLSTTTDPVWIANREQVALYWEEKARTINTPIGSLRDIIRHYAAIARNAPNAAWYEAEANEWKRQHPGRDPILDIAALGTIGLIAGLGIAGIGSAAGGAEAAAATGATAGGAGTIGASSTSYAAAATTGAAASPSALAPAVVSSAGATASWASGGVAATTSGGLTGLNSLVQTGTMALALARKGIAVLTGNDRPQQSPELNNPISSGGNFGSIYPELFGAPIGGAGAGNIPGQEKGTLGDILTRGSSLIWILAGLLLLGGLFFMLKRR